MSDPAGNGPIRPEASGTRSDANGRPTAQVADKVAAVEILQGNGHPHAPGYSALCSQCRLAGREARMLALYDREGAFVGFGYPHGWAAAELPERIIDRGGRAFDLTPIVTPTTVIYAEAGGAALTVAIELLAAVRAGEERGR